MTREIRTFQEELLVDYVECPGDWNLSYERQHKRWILYRESSDIGFEIDVAAGPHNRWLMKYLRNSVESLKAGNEVKSVGIKKEECVQLETECRLYKLEKAILWGRDR